MKKILAFTLALLMVFGTACGNSEESEDKTANVPTSQSNDEISEKENQNEMTESELKTLLKKNNSNAKTAYMCAADYVAENESKGIVYEDTISKKYFEFAATTGLELEGAVPTSEGDLWLYNKLSENGITSGSVFVGMCELDGVSTFFVQIKTSDNDKVIGQYPDSTPLEDAYNVTWGEYHSVSK